MRLPIPLLAPPFPATPSLSFIPLLFSFLSSRRAIFQTLAGILHLGNVAFAADPSKESGSVIANMGGSNSVACDEEKKEDGTRERAVELAGAMLGCDPSALRSVLLSRRLLVSGEWFDVPLNTDQARDSRDALAKVRPLCNCHIACECVYLRMHGWCCPYACECDVLLVVPLQELYSRTFDWLVQQVNASTAVPATTTISTISVLDIFGFEVSAHCRLSLTRCCQH